MLILLNTVRTDTAHKHGFVMKGAAMSDKHNDIGHEELFGDEEWFDYEEYGFEMPDGDGSRVVLQGPEKEIDIADVHLYYREGVYLQKYEDGELYADWGLTCFYEDNSRPEKYLYIEQDSPEISMHNLKHMLLANR